MLRRLARSSSESRKNRKGSSGLPRFISSATTSLRRHDAARPYAPQARLRNLSASLHLCSGVGRGSGPGADDTHDQQPHAEFQCACTIEPANDHPTLIMPSDRQQLHYTTLSKNRLRDLESLQSRESQIAMLERALRSGFRSRTVSAGAGPGSTIDQAIRVDAASRCPACV